MSGTEIVGVLLSGDAELRALAPDLMEDQLPEDAGVNAVLIRTISQTDRKPLRRGAFVRVTERVAVTARADCTTTRKAIGKRVKKILAGRTGDVAGARGVSILPAGAGPSLIGPGGSFEQTQDFQVGFNEPA